MTSFSRHLAETIADMEDPERRARLQHRLDHLTKPPGSLGRLEDLAVRIGLILGELRPQLRQPQMVVCAADHGLAAQGVSAYPQAVTAQMVANFLAGGAAVSVLARQHGLALTVVDCGVLQPVQGGAPSGPAAALQVRRIGAGTADALHQPAMDADQCAQALHNGAEVVAGLPGNAVLLGEMGIGNTSAAALLMARLTGEPIERCAGAGTGLAGAALQHKVSVLRQVLDVHASAAQPMAALAALGGFEIATLVGVVLQAARERRVIVVDGFITTAAVLVACRLQPAVLQRCVFSHCGSEQGHALLLQHLGVQPLLQLGLRLGEGSGAALAWPLLVSACELLNGMATFESAGVSGQTPP